MAWSNVVGLGSSSSRQPLARRYSSSGSSSGVPYLAIHGAEALSVITLDAHWRDSINDAAVLRVGADHRYV